MPSSSLHGRPEDTRGYVLLVFLLFAALLAVGLYRILPKYVFEGQRIKEEELVFRGQQYQRGIQLYVRKFGRYPSSLEELEDTNQIRFVRKLYSDPMTEEGEWRLIHLGPDGVFYDSVQLTGTSSTSGSSSSGEGSSEQGASNPFNLSSSNSQAGDNTGDPSTRASANPNPTQQPRASITMQTGQQAQQPQQTFGGGGIAGVASKNEGEAIKIVGGFTHYNEWEFLYDYRTDPLGLAAVNRVSGGGQQQQQPNQQPGQQPPGAAPAGQQPVGRNPLTGQPIGIPTLPGGGPGSPFPIPGFSPVQPGTAPPRNNPLGRP
jgi:type II secretory pathway pseudopilin PulG